MHGLRVPHREKEEMETLYMWEPDENLLQVFWLSDLLYHQVAVALKARLKMKSESSRSVYDRFRVSNFTARWSTWKSTPPLDHIYQHCTDYHSDSMARGSELDVAIRASIVSMRFGAGMEAKAIAEKLNLEPGTVRTTCHRIKKAAGSEDLVEILKHCRTKSRSGRPSMKSVAAAATTGAADTAVDNDKDSQQPDEEHEALVHEDASTSPDTCNLAENFETTAWPERDLTAAANASNTNTIHDQPIPRPVQYHIPPALTTTLDPQLTATPTANLYSLQQWLPRKTWGEQSSVRRTPSDCRRFTVVYQLLTPSQSCHTPRVPKTRKPTTSKAPSLPPFPWQLYVSQEQIANDSTAFPRRDISADPSHHHPFANHDFSQIFTRNKMIGWTAVIFAIQSWLGETPAQAASATTPSYLQVGMAAMSLGVVSLKSFSWEKEKSP
jgi:DNA-binding CsgD family transcriptional regulator